MALHELLRIDPWELNRTNIQGYPIEKPKGIAEEALTALAHAFTLQEEGEKSPSEKFNIYFNVGIGDDTRARVDCMVQNGKDVLLLHVKTFKGGNVIYRTRDGVLHVLDSRGTTTVRQYPMSNAYARVDAQWMRALPGMNVTSMVVVNPTINGQGRVSSEAIWSGGVQIIELGALVEMLITTKEQTPTNEPPGIIRFSEI